MTFERKLVTGLEEITAVVFECSECKARIVLAPDNIDRPPHGCPRGHGWDPGALAEHQAASSSPVASFLASLRRLRDPLSERVGGFKIYLEFDAPEI